MSLRARAVGLAVVVLVGLLTGAPRTADVPATFRLLSVGTTVADAERSVAFYRNMLGFQVDFDVDLADPAYDRFAGVFASRVLIVGLSVGPSRIELIEFLTPKGRSYPADSRSNDEWFQPDDMISEISLAMTHGLGLKKIGSTIHPYPTQAEAIRKLGDQFNRTRLTPFVKAFFSKWLAWTR